MSDTHTDISSSIEKLPTIKSHLFAYDVRVAMETENYLKLLRYCMNLTL